MSKFPGLPKWEVPLLKAEDHPTALQIIRQNNVSLCGKTVLITGGTAGIGVETVRALASAGARVFVVARSVDKARIVLDKIAAEFPQNGGLEVVQCDLYSLQSVHDAAKDFLKRSDRLNLLILNAGIFFVPFALTQDGFESHLAVDHIAHHLLFKMVAPLMLKSSTPQFHSRVISVASAAHLAGQIDFNDINFTNGRAYTPGAGYAQAKLANIWFANHIEKEYGGQGLHGLAVHPGSIFTDTVTSTSKEDLVNAMGIFTAEGDYAWDFAWKNVEQGAATTVWAATSPELEGKGRLYLENASVGQPHTGKFAVGYSSSAFDEDGAAKLWSFTDNAISKCTQTAQN